jgi:guanylate kinase
MNAVSGILFIVSAPSGTGKTSLLQALLACDENLSVSVSYTTRPQRPSETAGVGYHFVDQPAFQKMIDEKAFLEYAEVFGNYYGTSHQAVQTALKTGTDVVLEIDWQGAAAVRQALPDAASIFIIPPSQAELRARLQARAQDDPEVIESRLAEAQGDMTHFDEFDYLVINDDFDVALGELNAIVLAERCRRNRRAGLNQPLLAELLSPG